MGLQYPASVSRSRLSIIGVPIHAHLYVYHIIKKASRSKDNMIRFQRYSDQDTSATPVRASLIRAVFLRDMYYHVTEPQIRMAA